MKYPSSYAKEVATRNGSFVKAVLSTAYHTGKHVTVFGALASAQAIITASQ